ncbi:MAG: HD domain-containing protein, partial [Candidatus Caldatribacteriota bacterium]|nr:HD domain-containing protein [Candidatus Caldatribacteriota bacterium]
YFSPRYYTMLDYKPGELPMRKETWVGLMHPEDRKIIVPKVEKHVANAEPYEVEFRLKTKEGDWKWISGRGKSYNIDKKGISHRAVGVHVDITESKKAEERLKKNMDATIQTMSKIIEVKDPYTAGHQKRVSQLATAIAKELNLSPDKIEGIRIASLIHDIGKISVPTEILSKSTTLSDLEFSLIKEHSQTGYDILKSIDFSYPVAQIVLQHHERINGTGYPNKLKDKETLPEAKIMAVADVVEAMSSHRPYRPALGIDAALEEIFQNRGTLYDPEVVDACLKLFKQKGFNFE